MLSYQPQPHRKRALLTSRICQIIWRIYIVDHRIRIVVPGDVYSRDAHSPFVPLKSKSFFQPEIQAEIIRKTQPIRRSNKLLLLVQDAERKSRVVLEKSAEQ